MVNIRATLDRALQQEVIEEPLAASLTSIAKALLYKERTYPAILPEAAEAELVKALLRSLKAWLQQYRIDQKSRDALTMLEAIRTHFAAGLSPLRVSYSFAHTAVWEIVCKHAQSEFNIERAT